MHVLHSCTLIEALIRALIGALIETHFSVVPFSYRSGPICSFVNAFACQFLTRAV